jgi:hypothetical protein
MIQSSIMLPSWLNVESDPTGREPYYDVDLLMAHPDGSSGKVTSFFITLADSRGIEAQQAYAECASRYCYPDAVLSYVDGLVLGLHRRGIDNRDNETWQIVREEVDKALQYVAIISEEHIAPLIMKSDDLEPDPYFWDMVPLGKLHYLAGRVLPEIERLRAFCDDRSTYDHHELAMLLSRVSLPGCEQKDYS